MIDLILKKSKERSLLRRHPWVYDTAVHKVVRDARKSAPESGETVRVVSFDGRFLAWAAYSPESTIRARCWSFKEDDVIDAAWFEKKLRHAVEARACLRDRTNAVRLVFGESDGLPGLIVDQYGDCLVTQFQAAGVEAHRGLIADLLMRITGAKTIFDRSDAATRQREGLPIRSELLRGEEPPAAIEVVEDGVHYGVDVRIGHKTGFYVDQRGKPPDGSEGCRRVSARARPRHARTQLLLLHGRVFSGASKGRRRRSYLRRLLSGGA